MTRDEIIQNNPLQQYVENKGAVLRRAGKQFATNTCPIVSHKKGHLCVNIDPDRNVWFCNDCGQGGSIIDWEMMESGQPASDVIKRMGGEEIHIARDDYGRTAKVKVVTDEVVETYPYTDENGNLLYEVVRYEPKSFRQRHEEDGAWVWNLEGVTRVPFRLPKIVDAQKVYICEGEKDVIAAESAGLVATCCSGGSGGWLSAYGDYFRGKDVVIFEHNDPAGRKYADAVHQSIRDKANSIKRMNFSPLNDLHDFLTKDSPILGIDSHNTGELLKKIDFTPHSLRPAPLYTIEEMEVHYRDELQKSHKRVLNFSSFMPSLAAQVDRLVPGEIAMVMAATGMGKTAFLQFIAKNAAPLKTLFFEMELPLRKMFERFTQQELKCLCRDVSNEYKEGNEEYAKNFHGLKHIMVCPESGINIETLEAYIGRSELKFGEPPALVLIDYVTLLDMGGRKRYEAMSDIAEEIKTIAKRTNTIIFLASQVSRPEGEKNRRGIFRPSLYSAKDSGSLENSSSLVLGLSRPDPEIIEIEILKNNNGTSGHIIPLKFDGSKMLITDEKEADNSERV